MLELPPPHQAWPDEPLSEVDVQRIWRTLRKPKQARWYARRPLQLSAAGALLVCALVCGVWLQREIPPLALRDAGSLTPSLVLGGEAPSAFQLSDGSRIALAQAGRLEVLENSASRFSLELRRGRAQFDVQPGGPRRWTIACAGLRVEVVGTSFVVDRDERGVAVEVKHGVVRVRGPGIEHGERRLIAGERVYVERQPPSAASTPSTPQTLPSGASAAPAVDPTAKSPASASPRSAPEHRGAPHPRTAQLSLAGLLREADEVRQRGDSAGAVSLLEHVRASAPGSVHDALASWTLARLRMPDAPSLAAADIARALRAQLPSGLREAARARLVEAHARAGALADAKAAADAYRASYPHGRYLREVERWTRSP